MSKILFISDNHPESSNRGAESSDCVLWRGLGCDFITVEEYNEQLIQDYDKYIVSNFAFLSEKAQKTLMKQKYCHIAHDFLFTGSRVPNIFPDCIVPEEHKINVDFLKGAQVLFMQSSLQEEIFKKNGFSNLNNLDGNLWTKAQIQYMVELGMGLKKNGKAAVVAGDHKGEQGSVQWCKNLNLTFDILPPMGYNKFLQELANYSVYAFCPVILESFCRVLVEAKMMGVVPLTTNACGAVHSDLWQYNGPELGEKLNEKREEIIEKLRNF